MYKIWLLRLVPAIPQGRLISGALIFTSLYVLFDVGTTEAVQTPMTSLFLSLIIAYIIPVFSFITEKTRLALHELRPLLALDDIEVDSLIQSVDHRSRNSILTTTGIGLLCGFLHHWLMGVSPIVVLQVITNSMETLISILAVLIIWVIMTTVVTALVDNARLFHRLGANQVNIRLLETRKLLPFGQVAVFSTLSLTGALAFFPIISLDSTSLIAILPGIVATGLPMFILLIVPIWKVHQRTAALKQKELISIDDELNRRLGDRVAPSADPILITEVGPILGYRREIESISTWPFDLSAMARLGLYLVIPPITWVGAALIEKLLDTVL